ncbi:hypothetical protein BDV97DRAFT_405442 [Delphinella strobiligena]|nr:hypothetical protein BDV97DRAFT_405442 [Delphinella strobiligena]
MLDRDSAQFFATWLLEAAKKCGYQPNGSTSNPPKQKKAKSKDAQAETKYRTTIKELSVLAQIVSKSALIVPGPILAIAKRAITARKDVTSWFAGQGNLQGDRKHAHFISVLEEICETLEWKTTKPSKQYDDQPLPKFEGGHTKTDIEASLNKFAALTVEEPQDVSDIPLKSDKIMKVEVVEEDVDEGEDVYLSHLFFQAYCLFQDLHNMRAYISQIWSEYRDNKIDAMTAAVVTDNALQLARDLVDDMLAGWPDFQSDDLMLQRLVYSVASQVRGKDSSPSMEVGLPYSKHMGDVADWCYMPTMILLSSFADVLEGGRLPVYKKGYFGTFNPKASRARMSLSEKFAEDKILLLELLPDFCVVGMYNLPLPTSDEITSGLAEFARTKKVTIWLSFATQILLDVHHVMRYSNSSGALTDLKVSGLRIRKTIEDYWKLSESHPTPKFWPKEGETEIKAIHTCVETWIVQDPLLEVRRGAEEQVGSGPKGEKLHGFLLRHPILCGLIMFHLNLRMQYIGQALVNQWYDVQQMAFLYNLVTQVPGMNLTWHDMDAFIKIHGESRIFVGNRLNNAAESLNRLEIVTVGISSVAKFASDSQNRSRTHRPDGKAKLLEPTTTAANLFRARYVANDRKRNVGIGNIDILLDKLSQQSSSGARSNEHALSDPQKLLQQKWSNAHNIGILQHLTVIKTKLFEEEPVILFNYFGMHKRSIELLRLIKVKEHYKFVQYFTERYMPDDTLISNLVLLIHHVARGSAQASRQLGIAGANDRAVSRIVASRGQVIQQYLQKNGDVACKELRVFCKNKSQDQIFYKSQSQVENASTHGEEAAKEFAYWFTLEEVMDPKALASLMTGIAIA